MAIQAGMVTIQVVAMFLITSSLMVLVPRAKPTPITVPTRVCVGETGIPRVAKRKTTDAADICAAKPLDGMRSVILRPTVSVILPPAIRIPITIPRAPMNLISNPALPPNA